MTRAEAFQDGREQGWRDKDAEIERLRAALKRIAEQDYDTYAGDPTKWPSTIASDALRAHQQLPPER